MGLMAMTGFAGCDKIEPEERLIALVTDEDVDPWPEGAVAYVEKYTGPRCSNCPNADRMIEGLQRLYGDHLIVVSVNSYRDAFGAPYNPNPDMRVAAAQAWEVAVGDPSLPAAFLNRGDTKYEGSMSNLGGGIDEALMSLPPVKVDLTATLEGQTVTIGTDMELREECTASLTLTLMVIEDSLRYKQDDGTARVPDYVHNHMLRAVVTDSWGKPVTIGTAAGSTASDQTTYTIGTPAIVPENSHIVALVCNAASTHQVLGCAECHISTVD